MNSLKHASEVLSGVIVHSILTVVIAQKIKIETIVTIQDFRQITKITFNRKA